MIGTTRIVTGHFEHADGSPWEDATIVYHLMSWSYLSGSVMPSDTITDTTDEEGDTGTTLWTNTEGQTPTVYTVTLPDGSQAEFILPPGETPISLPELFDLFQATYEWNISDLDALFDARDAAIYAAFASAANASLGDGLVGYRAPFTGGIARTVHDKFATSVVIDVADFGPIADDTTYLLSDAFDTLEDAKVVHPQIDLLTTQLTAQGGAHPLSERYATIELAQVDYPAAVSLYDEIDLVAVEAAIAACSSRGGGVVQLAPTPGANRYRWNRSPAVPSNVHVRGAGIAATKIQVPGGVNVPGFTLYGVDNARVSDLMVYRDLNDGMPAGAGYGVDIGGDSRDILIERCSVWNVTRGFNASGARGTQSTATTTNALIPVPFALGSDIIVGERNWILTDASWVKVGTEIVVELDDGTLFPSLVKSVSGNTVTVSQGPIVEVASGATVTKAPVMRVTFRDCFATNSVSFGFNAENCETVSLLNCYGYHNRLDGAKVTKIGRNVSIIGGQYNRNGNKYLDGDEPVGDGIDIYAGADQIVIRDVVCDWNSANGITMKTHGVQSNQTTTFGFVRNAQITNIRCCNNSGWGAIFIRLDDNDFSIRQISGLVMTGGYFAQNAKDGLLIHGRHVKLTNVVCQWNTMRGILLDLTASNVEIIGCDIRANSQELAGKYDGIEVWGNYITISGGTIFGSDADIAGTDLIGMEADLVGLTRWHRYNVFVRSVADNVKIALSREDYAFADQSNPAYPQLGNVNTTTTAAFRTVDQGPEYDNELWYIVPVASIASMYVNDTLAFVLDAPVATTTGGAVAIAQTQWPLTSTTTMLAGGSITLTLDSAATFTTTIVNIIGTVVTVAAGPASAAAAGNAVSATAYHTTTIVDLNIPDTIEHHGTPEPEDDTVLWTYDPLDVRVAALPPSAVTIGNVIHSLHDHGINNQAHTTNTTTTEVISIGETAWTLTSVAGQFGDRMVELTCADGSIHRSLVQELDGVAKTITVATGPTVAAGTGAVVRLRRTCLIESEGYGSPELMGAHGTKGSKYIQLDVDATIGSGVWYKTRGDGADPLVGWSQLGTVSALLQQSVDFADTPANAASAAVDLLVPGAAVGDGINFQPGAWTNLALIPFGFVSAANIVRVWVVNATTSPINAPNTTFRLIVFKR